MIESLIVYINRDGKSGFLATSKKRGVIWVKKLHGLKSTRTFRGGFRGCQKTLPATSRMDICPYWYILEMALGWFMIIWSRAENWLLRSPYHIIAQKSIGESKNHVSFLPELWYTKTATQFHISRLREITLAKGVFSLYLCLRRDEIVSQQWGIHFCGCVSSLGRTFFAPDSTYKEDQRYE